MVRGRAGIAAVALALTACGSSSPHRPSGSHGPAAPAVASPAATRGALRAGSANGEASKPPEQILKDAGSAFRRAGSYAFRGTIVDGHERLRVSFEIAGPTSFDYIAGAGRRLVQVISVGGAGFLRANYAELQPQLGSRASLLAGRWLAMKPSAVKRQVNSLRHVSPRLLATCLAEDHGTLRLAGATTVNGQRAIVIRDSGGVPGAAPGDYLVAATGPPYLLRLVGTGRALAGGHIDACNDGKGSNQTGTITFSRFGRVPPIRAPSPVVNLGAAPGA